MSNISNLKDTIIPKSDQLNAEQLLGSSMTVRVTAVHRRESAEQPISINYENDNGRPYKPCKTMRKVLILAWGEDGNQWTGKSMTLFCDQNVKWAGEKVGGVRISHMSHIEREISVSLSATRGKKQMHVIKELKLVFPAPLATEQRLLSKEEREMGAKEMRAAVDESALKAIYSDWYKLAKSNGDTDAMNAFTACKDECKNLFQ